MPVRLYLDVHVDKAIHDQLRLRAVDVLRAQDDSAAELTDEELLQPGRDSGYLWRAATFTYFREQTDGLYVETETTALSREFPPLLGWIIEPIARRLGRRSVATSLQEFIAAIQKPATQTDAATPTAPPRTTSAK